MRRFLSWIAGRPRSRSFVAIDAGSHQVIRSLLFREQDGRRTVLNKRVSRLPLRERGTDLLPNIGEHLEALLAHYVREAGNLPEEILVGLGGRFVLNEIASARQARERPDAPIDSDELYRTLRKFLAASGERMIGQNRYCRASVTPFRIRVDGYPVDALSRRTCGRAIEIPLIATYAAERYGEMLSSLRSILGGMPMRWVSNQAAVAAAAISSLGVSEALLIRVGAGITEMSLIAESAIAASIQFAIGGDAFTRAIAGRLDVPWDDAERIKRQVSRLRLPEPSARAADEAIGGTLDRWMNELVRMLKRDLHAPLPERVYLLGGGVKLDAIPRALSTRPWHHGLVSRASVNVITLNAETIADSLFVPAPSPLRGPEEAGLAALAWRIIQSNP